MGALINKYMPIFSILQGFFPTSAGKRRGAAGFMPRRFPLLGISHGFFLYLQQIIVGCNDRLLLYEKVYRWYTVYIHPAGGSLPRHARIKGGPYGKTRSKIL